MTARLALITITIAAGVTIQAQAHALQDVLTRAGEYHAAYVKKVSGVSLEEQTQLLDVTGGQTRSIVRISADVVLVNVNQQAVALRDVYAIDTRPTREHTPRILQLLGAPATPSVKDWEMASAYPGHEKIHFLLDILLKVNEPTIALQFIAASNQPRLKFKLDGRKKMNNVEVVGIRFEEPEDRDAKYMLFTRSNARASGRLWIDPVTGAVHQSELWVDSRRDRHFTENAVVSVMYVPHTALNLLLPSEAHSSYEEFDASGNLGDTRDTRDSAGGRRNVELRSTYSNATYAAIDLTKLR